MDKQNLEALVDNLRASMDTENEKRIAAEYYCCKKVLETIAFLIDKSEALLEGKMKTTDARVEARLMVLTNAVAQLLVGAGAELK